MADLTAYVVDPDEIAARIVDLHGHMGHVRHFLQMDIGGLPQEHFLKSFTLLATEVNPASSASSPANRPAYNTRDPQSRDSKEAK